MPPQAEQQGARQRHSNISSSRSSSSNTSIRSSLTSNEVAIDGIIYDLNSFHHPGGPSIGVFGGNDVTVQYKMIHSHHTTKKHLEKMKQVGIYTNHHLSSEYKFDTPFERDMKEAVFKIVRRGKEFGTFGWCLRCAIYVTFFFGLQFMWVFQGTSVTLAILYGIAQALIGLNVQHDANHGAASKVPWINDLLGLGADMIGSSRWLWMEQHWTHHAFTNHEDKDPDATTAEPLLLFNNYPPNHLKRKWFHQFQALYSIILMSAYWLASVTNAEVIHLNHSGAAKSGIVMENEYITKSRKYAIAWRLLYIFLNVLMPFYHATSSLTAFTHVMSMGISGSLLLAILFSMSHNFQGVHRYAGSSGTTSDNAVCWFTLQVETSCTYGGFVAGALTGGLNFQIEHHLFPRMSSAWYPYIAPTVREVCAKHGVTYTYYPWLWQNWWSTMKYMHETGGGKQTSGNDS